MKYILFLSVLVLMFFSCSKEEEIKNPLDIEIVTGLTVFESNNNDGVIYGNPNEKLGDLIVYPSLCNSGVFIYAQDTIRNLWLVKGVVEHDFIDVDFRIQLKNHSYTRDELSKVELGSYETNVKRYYLSMNEFDEGFYRVFVVTDKQELLWANICKDSNPHGNNGFYSVYDNYWK